MKVIGTDDEINAIFRKCQSVSCLFCVLCGYCHGIESFIARNDKDIKIESILITKKGDKDNE